MLTLWGGGLQTSDIIRWGMLREYPQKEGVTWCLRLSLSKPPLFEVIYLKAQCGWKSCGGSQWGWKGFGGLPGLLGLLGWRTWVRMNRACQATSSEVGPATRTCGGRGELPLGLGTPWGLQELRALGQGTHWGLQELVMPWRGMRVG